MKRLALFVCLLVATMAAQAQFEKGKWMLSPSISGLGLSYDTKSEKAAFGLEVSGGTFVMDNWAVLLEAGAKWAGASADVFSIGVGTRYYFSKIGVFGGTHVSYDTVQYKDFHRRVCTFGLEAGYAFFLSRSVTIEPSVYWDINKDSSKLGLQLGFGFYF